jgi:hypothetical protein
LYNKLSSGRNRRSNDEEDDEEEEEDENEENEPQSEYDVNEIEDEDHPCFGAELIERQTCGMNNKHCEGDVNGMPRKSKWKKINNSLKN